MTHYPIAVTHHAVERYLQRVPSAAKLERETVRDLIRDRVAEAFKSGGVRDHPGHPERRMVPFSIGQEKMFLALGPNTTDFPGEWAVIGVLFDREVGQRSIGTTLGDIITDAVKADLTEMVKNPPKAKFLVRIGGSGSKEVYEATDTDALKDLLLRRRPNPEDVEVFERKDFTIRTEYVVEPAKK
jgi:hypothetical protein